jgi:outer membrane protein OmpA-like peptidoglycan-associated protein
MKLLVLSLLTFFSHSFIALHAQQKQKSILFPVDECIGITNMTPLSKMIGNQGKIYFEVVGYTDETGSVTHNQKLSECRANYVADYLRKTFGDRILELNVEGSGELKSENGTSQNQPNNRRVDISWKVELPVVPKSTEPISQKPVKLPKLEMPEVETIAIDTSVKENIVLDGLSFIPGRHYPLDNARPILEKLFNTLKQNPTLEIEIQGFICCDYTVTDGFDNDTQEPFLSRNRAKFVYNYLVTEGIDRSRLSYKGYGSTRPKVFPEASPEDQQENRRVEIKVTKF